VCPEDALDPARALLKICHFVIFDKQAPRSTLSRLELNGCLAAVATDDAAVVPKTPKQQTAVTLGSTPLFSNGKKTTSASWTQSSGSGTMRPPNRRTPVRMRASGANASTSSNLQLALMKRTIPGNSNNPIIPSDFSNVVDAPFPNRNRRYSACRGWNQRRSNKIKKGVDADFASRLGAVLKQGTVATG